MTVRIRIRIRRHAAALAVAAALMASVAGCTAATTPQGPGADVPDVAPSVNASAAAVQAERTKAQEEAERAAKDNAEAQAALDGGGNRPEEVRDAFAGLQATYQDGCAPGDGNCAYFLGRVNEELTGLDRSMKADQAGPKHFKEPLEWIGALHTTLAGDTSTDNLEKHREQLLGTRDRVNTWMQGHPEDYR